MWTTKSWISMDNYVVMNWNWIPVLLTLGQLVDGGSADNLKHVMLYTP
jgi:hypothetical protein